MDHQDLKLSAAGMPSPEYGPSSRHPGSPLRLRGGGGEQVAQDEASTATMQESGEKHEIPKVNVLLAFTGSVATIKVRVGLDQNADNPSRSCHDPGSLMSYMSHHRVPRDSWGTA